MYNNLRCTLIVCLVLSNQFFFAQTDETYCRKQHRVSVNQIDYEKFENGVLVYRITTNLFGDTIGWIDVVKTENKRIVNNYRLSNLDTLLFNQTIFDKNNRPLFRIRYPEIRPDTTFLEENEFGDRIYSSGKELVNYERDSLNRKVKEWYGDNEKSYFLFKYNDDGLLIRGDYISENYSNYYELLKYDVHGNLTEIASFDSNHLPLDITHYEYDDNSFLFKEWGYVESPFIPENYWEIRYEKIECP